MEGRDEWRLGHRPQLDVIRAAAIALVVACHAGLLPELAGDVGVTMFFALSGFLITALLLEERTAGGRISLRRFYFRRACRLLPALALFLTVMGVVSVVSDASVTASGRDFLGAVAYVGNYTTGMQGRDTSITHTWSLAIEEQFYIIWPCVLIGALSLGRGRLAGAMLAVSLGSAVALVLRALLWDGGEGILRVLYGTDTRIDGLLIGCLGAMWLHGRATGRIHPRIAAGLLAVAAASSVAQNLWLSVVVIPTVVALATSVAIVLLVQGAPMTSATYACRSLQIVGQRSYGIYLWHYPLVASAAALAGPTRWVALVIAALLTAAITHLSWRCLEEPFLCLKDRAGSVEPMRSEIDVR